KGSQKLIDKDIFFINQITKDNFEIKESKVDEDGLSMTERQWTQIEWNQKGRHDPYIDKDALKGEFSSWKFPLHFIDFETTMVAIPFNKGRRPYEQVAFQFSHHVVYEDGRIEHADQYLNKHRGIFPNFDFVRSLKRVLEKDRGTIFSYAPHENTVLCQIREQLKQSKETDAQDLIAWIETITKAGEKSVDQWCGDRVMVDLCKMVKKYFYHPLTKGSNSIKKVLPAILNTSDLLKERYSKPTYGTPDGIKSLNHKSLTLIEYDSQGNVKDPYKQLPPIYQGLGHELNFIFGEDELADGGAAMTAYAMMQFTEMSDIERDALASALLKYCELDTFAMVLLYEYWKGCLDKDRVFQAA
nr:DUF2779 domain-containing protein [Oligoflexales bacterium]